MQRAMLLVIVLATPAARAQEHVEPARGVFLVANPTVKPGPFFRSVVVLLDHSEVGTLGLVVNHPSSAALSDVLPGLDVGPTSRTLYIGGPVGLDIPLVLFRSSAPPEGVARVMEDVYYTVNPELLGMLVKEGGGPDQIQIFLGYSGWVPGQLDAEIREGTWEVVHADADTLFRTEPERLWDHLSMTDRTYARTPRTARPSSPAAR